MMVSKQNVMTGQWNTMDINITADQWKMWQSGTLIQDAAPQLTEAEREFLISGMTPAEWDAMFEEEGLFEEEEE